MEKILRNVSRKAVNTTYNGKHYHIAPKGTIRLDSVKDEQCADYLLQTYGFLQEITKKQHHTYKLLSEEGIQKARPKKRAHY